MVCESHNVFIFWNIDTSSFDLFSITHTVCHGLCGSLQLYDIKQKLLRIGVTLYNLVSSQSKKPILLPQNDSFVWASSLVCFLLLYSSLTCDFIYHTWMHYAFLAFRRHCLLHKPPASLPPQSLPLWTEDTVRSVLSTKTGGSVCWSVTYPGRSRPFYMVTLHNQDGPPSQPDTRAEFLAPPIISELGETPSYQGRIWNSERLWKGLPDNRSRVHRS